MKYVLRYKDYGVAIVVNLYDKEMKFLLRFLLWRTLVITLVAVAPVVMSVVSFVTFMSVPGNVLLPNVIFTSLSLFNLLRLPLTIVPMLIGVLVQLVVSLQRFSQLFLEEERPEDSIPLVSKGKEAQNVPILQLSDGMFCNFDIQ